MFSLFLLLKIKIKIAPKIGNKVIDHESIVGRNGSDEVIELVLIYEVNERKITKITVIKK